MLSEIDYRGYRIVWEAWRTPEKLFWTGKAEVVPSADASGANHIHRIAGSDYFLNEDDARDHLVSAAKEWIENIDKLASPSIK